MRPNQTYLIVGGILLKGSVNLFGAVHEQQHAHGKKTFGKSFLRVIPTVGGGLGPRRTAATRAM